MDFVERTLNATWQTTTIHPFLHFTLSHSQSTTVQLATHSVSNAWVASRQRWRVAMADEELLRQEWNQFFIWQMNELRLSQCVRIVEHTKKRHNTKSKSNAQLSILSGRCNVWKGLLCVFGMERNKRQNGICSSYPVFGGLHYLLFNAGKLKYLLFSYLAERQLNDYRSVCLLSLSLSVFVCL